VILVNPFEAPIDLEDLLRIERQAYPAAFREMQHCEDWQDVADYSEVPLSKLVVLSDGHTWYAIIARHLLGRAEFVDLAKTPGSPTIDWLFIVRALRSVGVRKIEFDAREGTSYRRFVQQLELLRGAGVRLLKDKTYEDERGETMHAMVVKL
jgi:hypothetical protein